MQDIWLPSLMGSFTVFLQNHLHLSFSIIHIMMELLEKLFSVHFYHNVF